MVNDKHTRLTCQPYHAYTYDRCRTEYTLTGPGDEELDDMDGVFASVEGIDVHLDRVQERWKEFSDAYQARPQICVYLIEDIAKRFRFAWHPLPRYASGEMDLTLWGAGIKHENLWTVRRGLDVRMLAPGVQFDRVYRAQWRICLIHAAMWQSCRLLSREADVDVANFMRLEWTTDRLVGWSIETPDRPAPFKIFASERSQLR